MYLIRLYTRYIDYLINLKNELFLIKNEQRFQNKNHLRFDLLIYLGKTYYSNDSNE